MGQPPAGGGHGGVRQGSDHGGSGLGLLCRSTSSCSPDHKPSTAAQPSIAPAFSKRFSTKSRSAPTTRIANRPAGVTVRSRPPGNPIGRLGWNQSPRLSRTRRPVAATRSPSRITRCSRAMGASKHDAAPGTSGRVPPSNPRVTGGSGMRAEVWVASPESAVGVFTTAGTCQGGLGRARCGHGAGQRPDGGDEDQGVMVTGRWEPRWEPCG